jgi:acyl-CoA reductase-like NAD-dependent aldehyde dehydrogenase
MINHFPLMIPEGIPAGRKVKVTAPYDGTLIATVDTAGRAAIETALHNAYSLFKDKDSHLTAGERIEILDKTAAIMAARFDELAIEAAQEGGKPLIDSRVEVARAIDGIKNCIEVLRGNHGTEIPMNKNPASTSRLAVTQLEPIGVVVAVSAFNHPLNLAVHQIGPAIAAGCPVIIKPAEDTPLSCLRLVAILREAGLPDAWCQAMCTENHDVATALITDSRVSFLSFIGSASVGWMLRSKLAPGARCALEHGGVAPVIIEADADLEESLPLLAKGGFYHAGQVCVSVQRVYAQSSIAEKVAHGLADLAEKLKVGDPTLEETDIGPLIRTQEVDRVQQWVNEAVTQGAELICGGNRISASCYAPTVLLNPPDDAYVSQKEIFGPVICVYSYTSMDEALTRANALPYAFQAAVFTQNLDTALYAYKRLDASAVMVNDHTAFRVDWMPFAGLKKSGLGIGGIPHTFREMQIEKMLLIKSKSL